MTTSIDPSVDELLLLEENQYHMPNFVFANVKPIGAERKIGQPTNVSTQIKSSLLSPQRFVYPTDVNFVSKDIQDNSFEIPSSTMSIYNHFHFSPIDEGLTTNEFEPFIHHYLSSSSSSTSGISTTHSPRSSSHLLDNYIYQRQISSVITPQKFNQSISTRSQTAKTIPSYCATQTYPTSRFYAQHYPRNSFLNHCSQTRSIPPVFSAPFQCTRERFQVNSIGRPILRANNYNHPSQGHHFKIRR